MDRRNFLKTAGGAAAAISGMSLLNSCLRSDESTDTTAGEMTLRINPNTGDKVSLLGYGCMRWPMTKDADGKDIIDQEMTNTLVDHAMEHGVNYFDAAPVYLQGMCEKATGIALSRHPRNT